ncbi:alpha amylase [Dacryopinax primogenitus]|uniref:Alpha amylase n=1 Tax=Dacryopinax primogenitus (strain DJM 731) TaxID=1858805 RepID=M5GGA9_DACPD|nr:alpha amylase [Dacryopinax primogenitus]EJU05168.1 alpha amylase [Dacryopinax primogenitus]
MTETTESHTPLWWKSAIVYQVYPASFKDSTGNGSGDLRGITSKLDYLKALGVDIVWLCPIYKSPLADMGYDITDYQDINPAFGTLVDWEDLRDEIHKRKMKIVMDLVVNHSSDEHPWFLASRSSKADPKRDWYYWRPARYIDGVRKPPNNWRSVFGGSAWEWDEITHEYYLHVFAKEQPDLNWGNLELRHAIQDMMTWWIKRGIDGFRLDAIVCISKTPGLPDGAITEPDQEYQLAREHMINGPMLHPYLQELYAKTLDGHDLFTVGEVNLCTLEDAFKYINQDQDSKELQMIFNTEHLDLYGGFDTGTPPPRDLPRFKTAISTWQTWMHEHGGWNSLFLENHDHPRSLIRFMSEVPEYRQLCAKALALTLCTLSGTLFIYQGQEIGMINLPREWGIDEYLDIATQNWYKEQLVKRQKETGETSPDMSDNSGLPMQWDASLNGGFSTGKPWMRAGQDAELCNVEKQEADPNSVLNFWRKLIHLRQESQLLVYGAFEQIEFPGAENAVFAYIRRLDDKAAFVAVNFKEETAVLDIAPLSFKLGNLIIGNYGEVTSTAPLRLSAYEGVLFELAV